MAQLKSQEQEPGIEGCGRAVQQSTKVPDGSEERRAPNGKLAVLVNGKWPGILHEEGSGSCGTTSKEMVYFNVESVGQGVKITSTNERVTGKDRKALNKQIHHEKTIKFFEARTVNGEFCQLFTL